MIIPEANRLSTVKEYYFSKKLQEIRDMAKTGAPVINLGIGSPDFAPSEATVDALCQSAKNGTHHGYQSYRCIPELRQAMAGWYQSIYQVALDPEGDILPLIGSKEGIMHISSAFLNPGDEVLVPNPGYPTYAAVSRLVGATIKPYDLEETQGWGIDVDKLAKEDLSKVKIMWVNFPNMPTGASGEPAMFQKLIALAKERGFLLCNDNPYSMVLNDNPMSLLQYPGAREVVVELNSLSKSHNMAGWRMGWVAGDKPYIDAILKVKSNIDSGMFLPVQHAAIEAMRNGASWHSAQNDVYAKRREKAWALMDKLGAAVDTSQVGMFVWAKVSDAILDVETYIDEILYGARVFITPGFVFGTNGQRYIRMSLCSSEAVIDQAMSRINEFMAKTTAI